MQDTSIQFKTAKLAKEKGFKDQNGNTAYSLDGERSISTSSSFYTPNEYPIQKSSQTSLHKWLREKKKIFLNVQTIYKDQDVKDISGYIYWFAFDNGESETYNSYEEALEEGLLKGLSKIK